MQKIAPCLWFNHNAEEAIAFYMSVFGDGKILNKTHYPDLGPDAPGKPGTVMTIEFELYGQTFTALNGGPQFPFTNAISLMVSCDTQEEIDRLWNKLLEGGKPQACGWLTDKYGLSWQITPSALLEMIRDKNPAKVQAAMKAMMQMVKLDIAVLKKAYDSAGK